MIIAIQATITLKLRQNILKRYLWRVLIPLKFKLCVPPEIFVFYFLVNDTPSAALILCCMNLSLGFILHEPKFEIHTETIFSVFSILQHIDLRTVWQYFFAYKENLFFISPSSQGRSESKILGGTHFPKMPIISSA